MTKTTGETRSRRVFLSLIGGTGISAVAGCNSHLIGQSESSVRTADESISVGPDATGLTDDKRERYTDRMAETYGLSAAEKIIPDIADLNRRLQPGLALSNLVWDDTQSLTVTNSSGATLVESDNYAALYENEQSSSSTEGHYVYWLWSCARPQEANELRELWSHIDVTGGGDVMVYDPGGDVSDNGTVGPHPEKTGQDTDEFAVRWTGEHDGLQTVTGSLSERRVDGDERGFEWTVSLACAPNR
ncbi:hypothetical protein [Natrialba asiatica]|uniref:Lipoprotein n=1 Tax=Natrialba asiatica (strain ATCC 700177 / DSM 12278 / JCM 9576 / FERM P-10747 / NBRC 102637 / 172P1) TaxID=29540 RepID=M0AZI9_NATA1|nr:hypothetical protein [Natrialba asiatica]ELZ03940.1 hypothetical protein C481_04201 [Natrialba asiatica DSM 12278]